MGKKSREKASKGESQEASSKEKEQSQEKEVKYAAISDRLFAAGIDVGLLYFIVVPLSSILFPLLLSNGDIVNQAYQIAYSNQPELRQHPEQVLSYIIEYHPDMFTAIMQQYLLKCVIQFTMIGAFIIPFIHRKAATPGKMLVGIKVLDSITHKNLSLAQSVIRYLAYLPSFGLVGLGVIWANFNKRHRAWHDMLADSVVILDENRWYKKLWQKIIGK